MGNEEDMMNDRTETAIRELVALADTPLANGRNAHDLIVDWDGDLTDPDEGEPEIELDQAITAILARHAGTDDFDKILDLAEEIIEAMGNPTDDNFNE